MKRLAAVAVLQFSSFHIMLAPGSTARVVEDVRGKKIALAPITTSNGLTSRSILSSLGLASPPTQLSGSTIDPGIRRMREGTLDAFVSITAVPSEGVQKALNEGIHLMSLSTSQVSRLAQQFPFLRPATIRPVDYRGLASPVATVGVDSLLLCRTDLDDSLVHDLTRALFEGTNNGSPMHELHDLNLARAVATSIPLHPGAARYYRERELRR